MKRTLTALLTLMLLSSLALATQNGNNSNMATMVATNNNSSKANTNKKRGPIFRATKDQINQAQALLKQRGFYQGEQTGKLNDDTRAGLKKYQEAEGLKVTGTLNKVTLQKMNIELTEKQKAM